MTDRRNLIFNWERGSAVSNMIRVFKENGMKYSYNRWGQIQADLGNGVKPVSYVKLDREGDFYKIIYLEV